MSIGSSLAEARRQSGLTLTQVSQRTCIRETIIRGLERGDYSACGGDFYARGHIRSVARTVGIDPEPLVAEYDGSQPQARPLTAADVFQPSRPLPFSERRRTNWTAVLAVVLVLVLAAVGYRVVTSRHAAPAAPKHLAAARHHAAPVPGRPAAASRPRLVITLTASHACWVDLRTAAGRTVFAGIVAAGQAMRWVERQRMSMVIGNPAAIALTVNGANPVPAGTAGALRLSLHPVSQATSRNRP